MSYLVSFGADVEVFLRDKQGRIESAIGRIGGSKEEPRVVPNGNLQEDNILAEFAIDPVYNEDDAVGYIQSVLQSLQEAVPWATLDITSAHVVPHRVVDHPQAMEFGCDPDWDSWKGAQRQLPPPEKLIHYSRGKDGRFISGPEGHIRCAGGHIHLGFGRVEAWDIHAKMQIVRALDLFIGLPLRLLDPNTQLRDKAYGGYGSARFKPYGLEYRTPSNIWIKDPLLIRWVYRQSERALHAMYNTDLSIFLEDGGDYTADCLLRKINFKKGKYCYGPHPILRLETMARDADVGLDINPILKAMGGQEFPFLGKEAA